MLAHIATLFYLFYTILIPFSIIIFYSDLFNKKRVQLNQLHPHLIYSLLIARPPATGRIVPVMKSARSLAKNATALAMS